MDIIQKEATKNTCVSGQFEIHGHSNGNSGGYSVNNARKSNGKVMLEQSVFWQKRLVPTLNKKFIKRLQFNQSKCRASEEQNKNKKKPQNIAHVQR